MIIKSLLLKLERTMPLTVDGGLPYRLKINLAPKKEYNYNGL